MLSIRTQDLMALVPYDGKIRIEENYAETKGWSIVLWGILGTYATKERALEVLDEIEQHINGKIIIEEQQHVVSFDFPQTSVMETRPVEKIIYLLKVYQMPKE